MSLFHNAPLPMLHPAAAPLSRVVYVEVRWRPKTPCHWSRPELLVTSQ